LKGPLGQVVCQKIPGVGFEIPGGHLRPARPRLLLPQFQPGVAEPHQVLPEPQPGGMGLVRRQVDDAQGVVQEKRNPEQRAFRT